MQLDWNKINASVAEAYVRFQPECIPFNLFQAINKLENITVVTYRKLAEALFDGNVTLLKSKFSTTSNDAFLYRLKRENDEYYFLVYNDRISSFARIRFSIAHELGHYFLKHFEDSETLISRGGLSSEKYSQFENEADSFASALLINPIFLNGNESAHEIQNVFDVSKTAAKIAANRYHNYPGIISFWKHNLKSDKTIFFRKRKSYKEYRAAYLPSLLSNYTPDFAYCKDCHALNSIYTFNSTNYCSVCSSTNLILTSYNFEFYETEEQNVIDYKNFELMAGSHLDTRNPCPICGEEITSNNFCEVCGLYLINRCTGLSIDEFMVQENETIQLILNNPFGNQQSYQTISHKDFVNNFKGCDHPQSGKARYCASCGSMTTFWVEGLLKDYTKDSVFSQAKNDLYSLSSTQSI